MTSETIDVEGIRLALHHLGTPGAGPFHLVWGHGWGQSAAALQPLAQTFAQRAHCTLVDFPGFGASPPPPADWTTADYADLMARWLRTQPPARRVWVGHSFGCRVGLQLAARHPDLLTAMVLIAAPGVPYRTAAQRARLWLKVRAFKLLKAFVPEGPARDRLRGRFGSADYRSAAHLRPLLTRVIAKDLSDVARQVRCPTLLVYGKEDRDTPARIGELYSGLVPGARLVVLEGFDHHTILQSGRHQVALQIQNLLESLPR